MDIKDLLSLGAPGLLCVIAGLIWMILQLRSDLKQERARTEELADAMVQLNQKLVDRLEKS